MIKGGRRLTYKTCGFVLRSIDYGESDRIVTFYTESFGKVKGIAKGARRSKKRFANAIEIFSLSNIIFSRKKNQELVLVENCDVVEHYPGIREDLDKTLRASYFIELTDQFTLEGTKNPPLFQLIRDFLDLVDKGDKGEEITRFFELRLLKLSGYEPLLERCTICSMPVDRMATPLFNPVDGGVRCITCRQNDSSCFPVSLGTVKTLIRGKEIATGKINRLSFSHQSLEESEKILGRFIEHILGKELKSLRVYHEIRRMTAR